MGKDIVKKIDRAVVQFNKYRSPEATVKVVSYKEGELRVVFSGPFCKTCGFHDYFDDFKIALEDDGLKSETTLVEEGEDGAVVEIAVK